MSRPGSRPFACMLAVCDDIVTQYSIVNWSAFACAGRRSHAPTRCENHRDVLNSCRPVKSIKYSVALLVVLALSMPRTALPCNVVGTLQCDVLRSSDTSDANDAMSDYCSFNEVAMTAKDEAWEFTSRVAGTYTIDVTADTPGPNFVAVLGDCYDGDCDACSGAACLAGEFFTDSSSIEVTLGDSQTVAIVVDGPLTDGTCDGPYEVRVVCPIEVDCDDGLDGDGDSAIDCDDPDCLGQTCVDALACTTNDVCLDVGSCAGTPDNGLCGAYERCDVDDGCVLGECWPGNPCDGELVCNDGVCGECVPDCSGMNCGDDGCGGSCGDCDLAGYGGECNDGVCTVYWCTEDFHCPGGYSCTDYNCVPLEVCGDTFDNDGDGQTDCEDVDCCGDFSCSAWCDICPEYCNGIDDGDCDTQVDNGAVCDDGLDCTTDRCDDSCQFDLQPGFCLIDGVCIADGAAESPGSCMVCDMATSTVAWSPAAPGASCDDGLNATHTDQCDGAGECAGTPYACTAVGCEDIIVPDGTGCVIVYYLDDGTPCEDGDLCTNGETCSGTACTNGQPVQCLAPPDCQQGVGSCYTDQGCVYDHVADDTDCDDGNACTENDVCSGGGCQSGTVITCNDANVCTDDSCDPATGCVFAPNTVPCDDGDVCTESDTCSGGACQPGTAIACDDGNPCTDNTCDPTGGCTYPNNTAPCDDGDACTVGDVCGGGSCQAGSAPDCDDGNICTDDSCDSAVGCTNVNNTASCDDGNACTMNDVCAAGVCSGITLDADSDGHPPLSCGGGDCDDSSSTVSPDAFEGGAGTSTCTDGVDNDCDGLTDDEEDACVGCTGDSECDDGNVCNGVESCDADLCVIGTPLVCNDSNICTDDFCDPKSGCQTTPNTAGCDDGDECTTEDVCGGGTCAGMLLDADSDGYVPESCGGSDCDDTDGAVNPGVFEGGVGSATCTDGVDNNCDGLEDGEQSACQGCTIDADCSDDNACNGIEICTAGTCEAGSAPDCDDANVCTADSCDPATGCTNLPTTAPCDDGDTCTTGDACSAGVCAGTDVDCSNFDAPCTVGSCDPGTGLCGAENVADGTACDDADPCTANDQCTAGVCEGAPDSTCGGTTESDGAPPSARPRQSSPAVEGCGCTGAPPVWPLMLLAPLLFRRRRSP